MKTILYTLCFVLMGSLVSIGQTELSYDDDDNSDWQGVVTEHVFAVKMSPTGPCDVLELKYYVKKEGLSEGGFTALIYDWDGDQPAATADYEQIGVVVIEQWKEHIVVGDVISYDGDFVVGFLINDPAAYLGYDGDVEADRYWNLDITNSTWTEETSKAYFIRAVVEYTTTGIIEELEGELIQVYPNPAKDVLTIEASADLQKASFYNISGKLVRSVDVQAGKTRLNLNGMDKGVYFLTIENENSAITKKVIIQ
jgi:hypothetical protein